MATGEGKTLVATLPLYLNSLTGRNTQLVTVNDSLARRDTQRVADLELGDRRVAQLRLELAANRLDLGKLRHR